MSAHVNADMPQTAMQLSGVSTMGWRTTRKKHEMIAAPLWHRNHLMNVRFATSMASCSAADGILALLFFCALESNARVVHVSLMWVKRGLHTSCFTLRCGIFGDCTLQMQWKNRSMG